MKIKPCPCCATNNWRAVEYGFFECLSCGEMMKPSKQKETEE